MKYSMANKHKVEKKVWATWNDPAKVMFNRMMDVSRQGLIVKGCTAQEMKVITTHYALGAAEIVNGEHDD